MDRKGDLKRVFWPVVTAACIVGLVFLGAYTLLFTAVVLALYYHFVGRLPQIVNTAVIFSGCGLEVVWRLHQLSGLSELYSLLAWVSLAYALFVVLFYSLCRALLPLRG